MTLLVNIHKKQVFDVYIGRHGRGHDGYFGNPYSKGTREQNVSDFKVYFYKRLSEDVEFKQRVETLRGLRLACFCVPLLCHGMVIIEYLDGISIAEQMKSFADEKEK